MTIQLAALDRLVEALASRPEVLRIWLFGSRARGDHAERSDIDLAVEAPAASRRQWLDICELAEETPTLLAIDVVRFESAPGGLRARILAEGKVLYER